MFLVQYNVQVNLKQINKVLTIILGPPLYENTKRKLIRSFEVEHSVLCSLNSSQRNNTIHVFSCHLCWKKMNCGRRLLHSSLKQLLKFFLFRIKTCNNHWMTRLFIVVAISNMKVITACYVSYFVTTRSVKNVPRLIFCHVKLYNFMLTFYRNCLYLQVTYPDIYSKGNCARFVK